MRKNTQACFTADQSRLCAAHTESPVGTDDNSPGQVSHRTPPWVTHTTISNHFADTVGASTGEHRIGMTKNSHQWARIRCVRQNVNPGPRFDLRSPLSALHATLPAAALRIGITPPCRVEA